MQMINNGIGTGDIWTLFWLDQRSYIKQSFTLFYDSSCQYNPLLLVITGSLPLLLASGKGKDREFREIHSDHYFTGKP